MELSILDLGESIDNYFFSFKNGDHNTGGVLRKHGIINASGLLNTASNIVFEINYYKSMNTEFLSEKIKDFGSKLKDYCDDEINKIAQYYILRSGLTEPFLINNNEELSRENIIIGTHNLMDILNTNGVIRAKDIGMNREELNEWLKYIVVQDV